MKYSLTVLALVALLVTGCAAPATTPAPAAGSPAPTRAATAAAVTAAPAVTPPAAATAPAVATTGPAAKTAPGRTVTVMTHDSFSVSDTVVAEFESSCGCKVAFLKSGDAGLVLNKAILSKGQPLADVLYGVDNSFLSRALAGGIFQPYASPQLAGIPDEFKLDKSNQLLPVDYGYVALNYDKAYFETNKLAVPKELRDLTKPEYKGLLVVENPATSSPGLAFLATTVAVFGEQGSYTYLDFWRGLRANDVFVAEGWEDAYYNQFSGGSAKGDRPLVVSYATSPAAEVIFADPKPADSPTGNILPAGQTYRQIEFVGILKGAPNADLAQKWIDFMLGPSFQADVPLQMFVYPVRSGVQQPEEFAKFAQVPQQPAALAPEMLESGRERWLQAWTAAVLR